MTSCFLISENREYVYSWFKETQVIESIWKLELYYELCDNAYPLRCQIIYIFLQKQINNSKTVETIQIPDSEMELIWKKVNWNEGQQ